MFVLYPGLHDKGDSDASLEGDLAIPVLTQKDDEKRFFRFNITGGVTP
jgi:hypothetical protein